MVSLRDLEKFLGGDFDRGTVPAPTGLGDKPGGGASMEGGRDVGGGR